MHPNLMVREDARKTIGCDGILKIGTKLPNPSGEFSTIGGPQKSVLWVGNTLVRVLDSNGYFYT